jgi:hypothetical protein
MRDGNGEKSCPRGKKVQALFASLKKKPTMTMT